MGYFAFIDLVVVLMERFLFPWTWLSSYGKSCSIDLVVALWKTFRSMDLVVVPFEIFCFHRLDCCLMENFCSHGLGCCPMESFAFYYHRLDCCLMDVFLLPWTWLLSYERFSVPWTWLSSHGRFCCSHGLGCRPVENFGFD